MRAIYFLLRRKLLKMASCINIIETFLALPVIPELKITDQGLFDVKRFQHISVEA
jgi:adenine deaminase